MIGKFVDSSKGFGFVEIETPGADDLFIPPHFVCGALHGDSVEVKTETDPHPRWETDDGKTRQIGRIIRIIKRGTYVGTYYTEGAQGYVRPMEAKIPYAFAVPPKSKGRFGLGDGHRVVFSVDKRERPENALASAFITEMLGHMNDPGVDVLTLVRQAGIPYEWPDDVADAAAGVPTEVGIDLPDSSLFTRLDLRDWRICTIDGDDTKDIDDAISLTVTDEGNFTLGVHIADVAYYVAEGSPIDREALRRGTSVYLADRVIPMLPHSLSSGICSLFPDTDRLALSCVMTVNVDGHVIEHGIYETIINSKKRWTYNEAEAFLVNIENEQKDEAFAFPDDLAPWVLMFKNLNALRDILYKKRRARGALDFDLPEAKIRVDENGLPVSIEPYVHNRATGIIEECMILCNETVAAHCLKGKVPFIFRTHEPPNAIKMTQLSRVAQNYGVKIPATAAKPKALQKVLSAIADSPAAYAVSGAILRALPQAHYTPDNPSHYGLASEAYCHFTSPIRRYADLQAHRIIKNFLNTPPTLSASYFKQRLPAVCAQASHTEREAEALERDVTQLKKVQFMQGYEGETFTGIVSGITAWGVYVMLPSTVEGMIPAESLKKSGLRYDKDRKCYVSNRNRTAFAPGTKVTVRLISTDVEERKITFKMIG
ncbi:MAG: ribonuclease R [Defluviitaleaceae bacterium]|nr:ribonuclease R [Defluviitaleaceae bacterium]